MYNDSIRLACDQGRTNFLADKAMWESKGVSWEPGAEPAAYLPPQLKADYRLAMDAQPALFTTANAGFPALATTYWDPAWIEGLFAPINIREVANERRIGNFAMETSIFNVVEFTGETTSYGDFNENGMAKLNANFPQRQAYRFQTGIEYGDLEIERAGLARLNYVSLMDKSAIAILDRESNYIYAFGVSNMQNYGLLNDPNLSASLTPGTKVNGNGNVWMLPNGGFNATPLEAYSDIVALVNKIVTATGGHVNEKSKFTLVMSPSSALILNAITIYGPTLRKFLTDNFNMRIVTAVQYGVQTTANPQGLAAGNFVQLIADEIDGQESVYLAYAEKMRGFPIVREMSGFKQKRAAASWGAIIVRPMAIASMIGV